MERAQSEVPILSVVVGVIAVVFAFFAGTLLLMSRSMMGGMMGGQSQGPGAWDIGLLVLAIAIAFISLGFALRGRRVIEVPVATPQAPPMATPSYGANLATSSRDERQDLPQVQRLQEAAIVRTLGEDERRLYLQIREAGGSVLQRDLVASGAFSKAKVTRLLDKLERKGLVVRERYGATNRVRLTWKVPLTP